MTRLLIIIVLIIPNLLFGQKKAIPISVSVFNESTSIPFTKFIATPIHPGIQLGTELDYKCKENSRIFQTFNINYFYHNYLAQGIGAYSELGYEYKLNLGFAFSALLGIGYMHTFATTKEFTFSNGQYKQVPDKGNARLFPSLSLNIAYYLKKNDFHSPKLFIRYQSWAEYPYSPDFIPVMTHINLHIGTVFFLSSKSNKHD